MRIGNCLSYISIALVLVLTGLAPTYGQVSATATMTAVPDGGNYDYTITLNNTGTSNIEVFWFAWLPGYDFLTSSPTVTKTPTNWTTFVESGGYYGGYSIEFYDTGSTSPLAPDRSSSAFQFTSPDSPSILSANDPIFGYYPTTFSYVYQGAALASPSATINGIPITTVAEPSSVILLAFGGFVLLALGRFPIWAGTHVVTAPIKLSQRRRTRRQWR